MIPSPSGPGDILLPERPEPLRMAAPSAASWWDLLEEVQKKLRDLEKRIDGIEERLRAVESPREK